jgi:hypothetical protein
VDIEDEKNDFWPIIFNDKTEKEFTVEDKDKKQVIRKFKLEKPIESEDLKDGFGKLYEKLNKISLLAAEPEQPAPTPTPTPAAPAPAPGTQVPAPAQTSATPTPVPQPAPGTQAPVVVPVPSTAPAASAE